jgi:hypothetical protein
MSAAHPMEKIMRPVPFALSLAACLLISVVAAPAQQTPVPPSIGQTRTPSAEEMELFKLEELYPLALMKRDGNTFKRLLDPQWVYTDEGGLQTRDQVIGDITTGGDTVTEAHNEKMEAHVYNHAVAIITGILATKGHSKEGPFDRRFRFTDTWLRTNKGWVCIASQDMITHLE